jgi:hypothetical protein
MEPKAEKPMAMPNKLIAVDIVCRRLCVLISNSGWFHQLQRRFNTASKADFDKAKDELKAHLEQAAKKELDDIHARGAIYKATSPFVTLLGKHRRTETRNVEWRWPGGHCWCGIPRRWSQRATNLASQFRKARHARGGETFPVMRASARH